MTELPRPFAVIGFTMFIVLALLFDADTSAVPVCAVCFAAAFAVCILVKAIRIKRIFSLITAAGLAACLLLTFSNSLFYEPQLRLSGNTVSLRAVLTDEPELRYGNYYYSAESEEINGEKTEIKLRLMFSSRPEAEPFDRIEGDFTLYALGSTDDDILSSYKSSGIYLGGYTADYEYNVIRTDKRDLPFFAYILKFRNMIKSSVYRILPNEYGGLTTALLLGDRSGISDKTLSTFRNTGITHIICVSGLHLSLWGLLVLKIFRKLGFGERAASGFAAAAVVLIMLITGMSYSVIRSGIMMLVFLFANILSRQKDSLNSLGFALTVMSAVNPFSMGAVGLQLSALSSFGIILCSSYLTPPMKKSFERMKNRDLSGILYKICESIAVTGSAVFMTMPVAAKLCGGFTFAVFPANFLVVWAAGIVMVSGVLGGIVGAVSAGIFNLPGFICGLLCKYIIGAVSLIDKLRFLYVKIDSEKLYLIFALTSGLIAVCVLLCRAGRPHRRFSALICSGAFAFTILVSGYFEYRETEARIFDVGIGTAVQISYRGKTVAVGFTGTDDFLMNSSCAYMGSPYGCDAVFCVQGQNSAVFLNNACGVLSPEAVYSGMTVNAPENVKYLKDGESVYFDGKITVTAAQAGDGIAYLAETGEADFLICPDYGNHLGELPEEFLNADIVITEGDLVNEEKVSGAKLAVINAEDERGRNIEPYLRGKGLNCISTSEKGHIRIRFYNDSFSLDRMN